ncbi:MAG: bifunctional diaminohydroxyphosphoribosylaminopyrimidine deaminase/5-amino-6-(5-phosphoribosylamino)uracil reductase RibD [Gemmatimonadaceae bacterium]|nr:bifunctional diaminohydroxyphosphoribosylaminopyrimidine deaminase/5-amino-6-(5-phosphoribosylamino)uracil reductase RibD [Gemmatimonadaceae bacterium]
MNAASHDTDAPFMRRALDLARQGWGQVAPNPMVGAVLVQDGRIVGEGAHERFGGLHAEVNALAAAGPAARGATLYVTLEPCAHHGKTPPCVDAIRAAGVARVVVAMRDPNPEAAGGLAALAAAGIETSIGTLEADARELNAAFLHGWHSERPWVTLKLAITLDGAIADGTRTTSRVTGPQARRYAHHLRAGHDAVAVGMNTVRIDDPLLTVREAPAPRVAPARVIFSRTGRLSLTSTLANSLKQGPVIVLAEQVDAEYESALRSHGVEVVLAPDLASGMRQLRAMGMRSVLVEGGTGIAASLWEAGLVDRLVLVQAPIVFGRGALNAFAAMPAVRAEAAHRLRVVSREPLGDDIATTYAVRES